MKDLNLTHLSHIFDALAPSTFRLCRVTYVPKLLPRPVEYPLYREMGTRMDRSPRAQRPHHQVG